MPESYIWWNYLENDQQNALLASVRLLKREKEEETLGIDDFSFVVFPAAKAYEGFLKKLIYDLGFITKAEYEGERYRIGKALNPSLERELRHESIYDKLADFCQGKELPERLWKTWKTTRNLLFHWWPGHKNNIDLRTAEQKIDLIFETIDFAFLECKVKK